MLSFPPPKCCSFHHMQLTVLRTLEWMWIPASSLWPSQAFTRYQCKYGMFAKLPGKMYLIFCSIPSHYFQITFTGFFRSKNGHMVSSITWHDDNTPSSHLSTNMYLDLKGHVTWLEGHITWPGKMTPRNLQWPQLSADIYLRSKGNEASPIIIGRASAKVDENGFAGTFTINDNVLYIDVAHLWHLRFSLLIFVWHGIG